MVIGFLLSFAAGLTVGLEVRRPSAAQGPSLSSPPPRPTSTAPSTRGSRSPGGWFASQLHLTPDQRQKMDAIWSEVARNGRREIDKRRDELRDERDAAIVALLGLDDKPKYDAILKKHHEQQKALEREMRSRFEKAVEQTNALLTPEQQAKYKELLARHRPPERGERGRGGPGGADGHDKHDRSKPEHQRGDGGATPEPSH